MCKGRHDTHKELTQDEELTIPQRYSDLSTSESIDSEEGFFSKDPFWSEEGHNQLEEWRQSILNQNDTFTVNSSLFTPISEKGERHYKLLNDKVHKLLDVLNETMDSINIRDDYSHKPATIKLDGPKLSLLHRRRALLPSGIDTKY
ncbi:unnamed protein product [Blepharisma stoltei]|uniref:Uncharacterized protein n=1 Tax=Blepharisma stoltei TaxID=1481888 RepID=A0AAU9JG23_9CILI|nr:unnamed protein product [Blepharisma stoltei]